MSAFKRMYLDVPSELHASMRNKAQELHETNAVFIRTAIAERLQKLSQGNKKDGKQEKARR